MYRLCLFTDTKIISQIFYLFFTKADEYRSKNSPKWTKIHTNDNG
nr:MAG TPA: hypothetical protein [Caudoviricetes sp.]